MNSPMSGITFQTERVSSAWTKANLKSLRMQERKSLILVFPIPIMNHLFSRLVWIFSYQAQIVQIIDLNTQENIAIITLPSYIYDMSLSPDSTYLAVSTADGLIRIYGILKTLNI